MYLNHKHLVSITNATVEKPPEKVLHLPEKIVPFGTGALLRGLPDYFVELMPLKKKIKPYFKMKSRVLRVHPKDNVLAALRDLKQGERIS